jgi:hypothetical protein
VQLFFCGIEVANPDTQKIKKIKAVKITLVNFILGGW